MFQPTRKQPSLLKEIAGILDLHACDERSVIKAVSETRNLARMAISNDQLVAAIKEQLFTSGAPDSQDHEEATIDTTTLTVNLSQP